MTHEAAVEPQSLWSKLERGYYDCSTELPVRPSMPSLLRKRVTDLTAEDCAQLQSVKAAHERAMSDYQRDVRDRSDRQNERLNEFRRDLATEHNLTGHPKEPKLYSLAWEDGHSEGLLSVADRYFELAELLS